MSGLLACERPVLLDRDRHRGRRVRPREDFSFAREANALLLAAVEFNEACKEYAVVFTRSGGKVVSVAMLGLRSGENLFVDEAGAWDARYRPAFVRRHPFVLAQLPGHALGVCIDEAHAGVDDPAGEALFDAQGQETPFLRGAIDFLTQFQREVARTEAFCARLEQAGLLREMDARAELADGRRFTVNGLLVVDEKKLMALPDAGALALFRSGELHLVAMHLASLSNMQRLVDRMAQRQAPMPPAPQPRA